MPKKLTPEIITAAIVGFEAQKRSIDEQIAELRATLAGDSAGPASRTEPARHTRRKMSAAGRARIAAGQRKRWADSRKHTEPLSPDASPAPKKKRKLSRAGRAAIVAAIKKRWELKRAETAKAQPAAAKKATSKKAAVRKGAAKAARAKAAGKSMSVAGAAGV